MRDGKEDGCGDLVWGKSLLSVLSRTHCYARLVSAAFLGLLSVLGGLFKEGGWQGMG